jgi:DNA-binding XRE family transcriptional regulator
MDRVVLPFCSVVLVAKKPKSEAYPTSLDTLGDHLRKRRLNLGMLQRQVAEVLGVDTTTITNWEKNRCSPSARMLPRIWRFLGFSRLPREPT